MNQDLSTGIEITKTGESLVASNYVQVLDENSVKLNEESAITVAYNLHIPDDLIIFGLLEGDSLGDPIINADFVKSYFQAEELYKSIGEQLGNAKSRLKKFIESHNLGSISSNGMSIKYTPSTTTTSIDADKLRQKYAKIAAECSKVSARASSISISKSDK